jgi:UDP-N-acetylglucosamine 3-dehydrogenase
MAPMKPLNAAVLGVGAMGRSHARVYAEMEHVRLAGVADPNARAAARIAGSYGTTAYGDYRELLDREKPDLVSIAVPTTSHAEVALETISRGIHVLVEKPLAFSIDEGRQIIEAAESQGVKLAVGHIERFNPAVVEIKRRLGEQECHLLDADVTRVFAETEQKAHASQEDLLSALLRFSNGAIGVLDVNWLTPTKVRQLAVLGAGGLYLADYLTQDVYWYRNNTAEGDWDVLTVFRGAWEGDMVKLHFAKHEPLMAELQSFVTAVSDDLEPEVGGQDGLIAIDLSRTLVESGTQHVPLAPQLLREGVS